MAGVPVAKSNAKWKGAHVGDNGLIRNAVMDGEGYRLESTKIVVKKDGENPKIFNLDLGDDESGHRQLKQFLDSGQFRVLSMGDRKLVDPRQFKLEWGFNPDLKLTALKMAIAIVSLKCTTEVPDLAKAREELTRADIGVHPSSVAADLRDHPSLDAVRGDLCHVVYVEQVDSLLHAFVQFFGAIQVYVSLTKNASVNRSWAFLGTLDPITAVESFSERAPLRLLPFREGWLDAMGPIRKLNASAVRRGAKVAEMIKINQVRVDGVTVEREKPYWVTSWTRDVPKKRP